MLDEIDYKILRNLLVDSRMSSRKLALKLGLSTVTIITRLKKLEKEKIIKGYSARIDHQRLGYDLTAIIEAKAKRGRMIEVEHRIADLDNVCAVYDVTGSMDTIIVAKFKTRKELSDFVKNLSSIPDIENTVTHIVLNDVKEDFRLI